MRLSGLFNSCSKSALAGISEDSFQRSHSSKRFLAGARFVNKVPGEASDWENSECELLTIDCEYACHFGGKDNKECRQQCLILKHNCSNQIALQYGRTISNLLPTGSVTIGATF